MIVEGACHHHPWQLLRDSGTQRVIGNRVCCWRSTSNARRVSCGARFTRGQLNSDDASRPPQETVLEALSEAAKAEGRIAQTTNLVMGGTVSGSSDDEWKVLNEKVNSYPTRMNFTAIGSGGDDFVQAMVGAVESVVQYPIPEDEVKLSMSSKGRYVSVRIGPVSVDSSDQVQAVYNAMKRDDRMKYFL